jgi:hypothetical protein
LQAELLSRVPQTVMHALPGTGHLSMLESPRCVRNLRTSITTKPRRGSYGRSNSVSRNVHVEFSKIHGERQGFGDQASDSAIVDVASRMFSGPPFGGQTPAA